MNDEELAEILKYCSPLELYVVTWNNLLKRLFCPFKVKALSNVGNLKKGKTYWVKAVKVTMELKTVYVIGGYSYYYHHFDIVVD